jgi:cellulose biosynthesis protein BcsQ
MASTIAIYSMKGGVGKTTLAVNLAYCSAAQSSWRTLLWEIDAQGAATFRLGEEEGESAKAKRVFSRDIGAADLIKPTRWPRLDLLAADMSLRHLDHTLSTADKPKRLRKLLHGLATEFDCVLLDCPPGLGEVSDQVFRAVDLIVVPIPPTPLALRAYEQVSEYIAHNHGGMPPLLPVLSMVDRRKKLHREIIDERPDWPVIPQASIVERMAVEQSPVVATARTSPASIAIGGLWERVKQRLTLEKAAEQGNPGKLARIPSRKG